VRKLVILVAACVSVSACYHRVAEQEYKHCRYPRTPAQIAADDDSNDHDYWSEKCLPGWEVKP
jgi:hypothetical protein